MSHIRAALIGYVVPTYLQNKLAGGDDSNPPESQNTLVSFMWHSIKIPTVS